MLPLLEHNNTWTFKHTHMLNVALVLLLLFPDYGHPHLYWQSMYACIYCTFTYTHVHVPVEETQYVSKSMRAALLPYKATQHLSMWSNSELKNPLHYCGKGNMYYDSTAKGRLSDDKATVWSWFVCALLFAEQIFTEQIFTYIHFMG